MSKKGKGLAVPARELTSRHSRGFIGEENREQIIQKRGEISLSDKLGVKQLTRGGLDGISIGLDGKRGMVLNLDENKAYKKSGSVRRASAIQENRHKNQAAALSRMRELAADKNAPPAVRRALRLGIRLAEAGRTLFRVQNAAGNSTGTSVRGAKFDDLRRGQPKIELKNTPPSSLAPKSEFDPATGAANTAKKGGQNAPQQPPKSVARGRSPAAADSKRSAPAKPELHSERKNKPQSGRAAPSREKPNRPAGDARPKTSATKHQQNRLQPPSTLHAPSKSGTVKSAPASKPAPPSKSATAPPKSPTSTAASLSPKGSAVSPAPSSVAASPAFAGGRPKM